MKQLMGMGDISALLLSIYPLPIPLDQGIKTHYIRFIVDYDAQRQTFVATWNFDLRMGKNCSTYFGSTVCPRYVDNYYIKEEFHYKTRGWNWP